MNRMHYGKNNSDFENMDTQKHAASRQKEIEQNYTINSDLAWCLSKLRGLGHPAVHLEQKYEVGAICYRHLIKDCSFCNRLESDFKGIENARVKTGEMDELRETIANDVIAECPNIQFGPEGGLDRLMTEIMTDIQAHNDTTYAAVMEAIGATIEDDEPCYKHTKPSLSCNFYGCQTAAARNELRAKLRQSIAKIYGRDK